MVGVVVFFNLPRFVKAGRWGGKRPHEQPSPFAAEETESKIKREKLQGQSWKKSKDDEEWRKDRRKKEEGVEAKELRSS